MVSRSYIFGVFGILRKISRIPIILARNGFIHSFRLIYIYLISSIVLKILPIYIRFYVKTRIIMDKYYYVNKEIRYLLTHNFMIGWRVPSEPAIMRISDIDFDNGSIVITEPKKHQRKRIIIPEEHILTGKRYKSFKNWVDYWRPKVENQHSGDYLYLRPNGKPFTNDSLRMQLSRNVKPVWNKYYPMYLDIGVPLLGY